MRKSGTADVTSEAPAEARGRTAELPRVAGGGPGHAGDGPPGGRRLLVLSVAAYFHIASDRVVEMDTQVEL